MTLYEQVEIPGVVLDSWRCFQVMRDGMSVGGYMVPDWCSDTHEYAELVWELGRKTAESGGTVSADSYLVTTRTY